MTPHHDRVFKGPPGLSGLDGSVSISVARRKYFNASCRSLLLVNADVRSTLPHGIGCLPCSAGRPAVPGLKDHDVAQRSQALGVEALIRIKLGQEGPRCRIGVKGVEVGQEKGDRGCR